MKFSVFLTPAEPHYRQLHDLIRQLAERHGGSIFQPHVTIYGGRADEDEIGFLKIAVERVAEEVKAFSLKISGVGATEDYFRSVFLTFEEHPAPFRIHNLVKSGLKEDSGYRLFPHLSLAYLNAPVAGKEDIAAGVMLPVSEIPFNELRLVIPLDEERGWETTDRWFVAGRWRLR